MADVWVDPARCTGSGVCLHYAPKTFVHRDARAVVRPAPHDDQDAILTAAEACPAHAILLEGKEA